MASTSGLIVKKWHFHSHTTHQTAAVAAFSIYYLISVCELYNDNHNDVDDGDYDDDNSNNNNHE